MISIDPDDKFIEEYESKLHKNNNLIDFNNASSDNNSELNNYLNTDSINSYQIKNLYDYITKMRDKNNTLLMQLQQPDQYKMELLEKNRLLNENEQNLKFLQFENNTLINRTKDYQNQMTEWDNNLQDIMFKITKIEEENKCLLEDNKLLKSKENKLIHQVKKLIEKESYYEISFNNINENSERIKIIDNKVNFQVNQLELIYKQKIDKMASQLRENDKAIDKLTKDNKILMNQFAENDNFLKKKETEFQRISDLKDVRLRELEKCLCIISKEMESQNLKIIQNFNDYNSNEQKMKKHIFQIENHIEILKKKLNEKDKIIKFLEDKISVIIQ